MYVFFLQIMHLYFFIQRYNVKSERIVQDKDDIPVANGESVDDEREVRQ